MSADKSFVGKVEQNVDDLNKVRKQKPWLFYLIVTGFVVFGGLYVFEKFWGIPKLKEDISAKKEEIAELKRDRDTKANQLAPFLAAANRNFSQAPEDQRLELLLRRLNEAAINLETTASKLGKDRAFEDAQADALIKSLKKFTNWAAVIESSDGDGEARNLASQYFKIFHEAGWKIGGFGTKVGGPNIKGIFVKLGSVPEPELQRALTPVWTTFGYEPSAVTDTIIGPQTIKIFVGRK